MVRDSRIKEYIFPAVVFGAASPGSTFFTDQSVNGQLYEIKAASNFAGSVIIAESGNTSNLFVNRANISGASPLYLYPRALSQAATGSAAGYGESLPFVTNGPIQISIGSTASGTAPTFNFRFRYI